MRQTDFIKTVGIILLLVSVTIVHRVNATTWSVAITRFTTASGYDGYPVVTHMRDGTIWLLWAKAIGGNLTLFYKNSSDLGTTWSDEMNLTKALTPGNDQNPTITQAANGTIWLAWTSDRPAEPAPPMPDFYMNATPTSLIVPLGGSNTSTISVTGTNGFSDTVNLHTIDPPNINSVLDPPEVFVPLDGTATSILTVSADPTATPGDYTLTVRGDGASTKLKRHVDITLTVTDSTTSSSSRPNPVSSSSVSPSQIEDYEIFFKTSHDNGASWSEDTPLTANSADDLRPSIMQLANGTIMLVWQSNRFGNHDVFYMRSDGSSWSDAQQLTTDLEADKGPHIAQTTDGRIWVVWASKRTGDYEVFFKTYDGSSWTSATRLTYSASSDVTPSILQTVDDTIWVFWSKGSETDDNDVYYMSSSTNGASWSGSVQYTTDSNEDLWPSVTQTRDIKIWVTWTSNRADQPDGNWDVYYRTSLSGDVNENGAVDVFDLSMIGAAYGKREGMPGYNASADINKDGIVDSRDLAIVTRYYGET